MTLKPCSYTIINITFMAIIVAIFVYSLIFVQNHPVPSLLSNHLGIVSPSKGLSRAFSMIVRGNFDAAIQLNPHSIRIFSFFALQIILRAIAIITTELKLIKKSVIVALDISLSTASFIVCFLPLIVYTLSIAFSVQLSV